MHKIFQIDEVVKEITRHMSEWYTQRFILYLALSCKTISDPALDVLWETQCTLIDLLKTFPSDVWEVNQGKLVSDSRPKDFTGLTFKFLPAYYSHSHTPGVESLREVSVSYLQSTGGRRAGSGWAVSEGVSTP